MPTMGQRLWLRRYWIGWGAVVLAWFVIVYGGGNWLTAHRTTRVRLDFPFEQNIPLVPFAAYVYLSVNPLMWLSGWVLGEPRQWRALALTMITAITIAGLGFLLAPADLAYLPWEETTNTPWHGTFLFVRQIVGDHNLFPSLHVALAWICAAAYCDAGLPALRPLWIVWSGAIAAATLLAHQHHLVDVIGGAVVGPLCVRWVYRRQLRSESAAA